MLFCRQLAYLGATPEKHKLSRLEAIEKGISQATENIDSNLPEDNQGTINVSPVEVNWPEIPEAFLHLRDLFFASGQALQSGHGLLPLTWLEIKSFIEVNELDLTLWERSMLKKMSDAYCAEASRASEPSRPAPYSPQKENTEEEALRAAQRIMQNMRAFRGKS